MGQEEILKVLEKGDFSVRQMMELTGNSDSSINSSVFRLLKQKLIGYYNAPSPYKKGTACRVYFLKG